MPSLQNWRQVCSNFLYLTNSGPTELWIVNSELKELKRLYVWTVVKPHKKRLSRYSTSEDYFGYPHESVDRSSDTAQEYSNENFILGLESSSSTTDIMNENFSKFTRLISSASATEIEDTAGGHLGVYIGPLTFASGYGI